MWYIILKHGMSHGFIIWHQPHISCPSTASKPYSFFTKAFHSAHTEHLLWARHHNNSLLASRYPLQQSNSFPTYSHNVIFLLKNFKWLPTAFMRKPLAWHPMPCDHIARAPPRALEGLWERVKVGIRVIISFTANSSLYICLHGCHNRFLGCVFSCLVLRISQTCSNLTSASCQILGKLLHFLEFLFTVGDKTTYGRDCYLITLCPSSIVLEL